MEGLGKKVTYYRVSKGFSMKELAEGICDISTIYRLEKEKQLPRLEILNDICLKLEIKYQHLFPFNEEIDKLKLKCRNAVYNENFILLETLLVECENLLQKLENSYVRSEFKKFTLWHRGIYLHKKENNRIKSLSILNNLVNIDEYVSELDINILNSIGLIHLSNRDFEDALSIYDSIFAKILDHPIKEDSTLVIRVGYNYSNTLYKLKRYERALQIVESILKYGEENYLIYMKGEVYHILGLINDKLNNKEAAIENLKNSLLIFALYKDNEKIIKAENDLSKII